MKDKLRLFGAGRRAQVIADLVRWQFRNKFEIEGAYDDAKQRGSIAKGDLVVLGSVQDGLEDAKKNPSCFLLVAFGTRSRFRACELFMTLVGMQARMATLIAPGATVSESARAGLSTVVMPGVFLGCDVEVGHLSFIHGGAAIEHHSKLGNDVLVAPGVSIASKVVVKDHCFLGVGSCVAPEVTIGPGTVIGAGSVVVESQPPHCVVYGCPARRARETRYDDEVLSGTKRLELASWGQAISIQRTNGRG